MRHFLSCLFLLGCSFQTFATSAFASKAREKALQLEGTGLTADSLMRGFEKVEQKDLKLPLQKLKIPAGFEIRVFAVVPNARSLALGEKGEVFVGTRGDKVYRVRDKDLDGKADSVEILVKGLGSANGVAYHDGNLFVGDIPRIYKIANVNHVNSNDLKLQPLPQKFPSDQHHGWKFIRFGPDGWLYVPVGAPCNVCDPGAEYARLYRIDVNSDKKEVVAQGIRNTVGFDWNSKKELWFTDNGRDTLGEDVPPDEINKVSRMSEHFGFPFCFGKDVQDPDFKKPCSGFTAPQVNLPAHVAALGMRFWKDQIVFAEHGSWNRTVPQGYRVSLIHFENGKPRYEPWIEGWHQGNSRWGRPVDVEVYFDNSLLISDDEAGVIYQLRPHTK
jgi:glucose/arabinose dehydrogenase